ATHRALPLFPTRRSSDLAAARHAGDSPAKIPRRIVEQSAHAQRIQRHPKERLGSGNSSTGETGERVDLLDGIADGFSVCVAAVRSEEHTSELQSQSNLVC